MSYTSVGASSDAYSYLRSLLQQPAGSKQTAAASDPLAMLLEQFYPSGGTGPASNVQPSTASTPATPVASASPPPSPFSPDTLTNLIALQEQQGGGGVAARAQSVFAEFDANSDGQISKSEFENAFGAGADMSKVDGLFNALDTNGDGAVSQSEMTSAAQQSHSHHHHHHAQSSGSSASLLDSLMSATQGGTSQTSANADGSTTTTVSYADGSKVTMTTPAASSSTVSPGNQSKDNLLEQLIRLQAQLMTSSSSSLATI